MSCKIDIKGLGNGEHRYAFRVDGSFFEAYENDAVSDAEIDVSALLVKGAGVMTVELGLKGSVTVPCDRCLADLALPVDVAQKFAVRFRGAYAAEDEGNGDDEIEVTGDGSEIDFSQAVYDYVCTSLPVKKVHEGGRCDSEMMEKMKDILK